MEARDTPKIREDLIDLMLGEYLGDGLSRDVYVYRPDETIVVKLERSDRRLFSNVREWSVWHACEGLAWARKWLARPINISENGRVLLMERTTMFKEGHKFPTKAPSWLCDFKPENYGWGLKSGNFVCHDYASDLVTTNCFNRRMRKIDWMTKSV